MKTLLILGPPGAGKGTQAKRLAEHLNLSHLSTGEIFRANMKQGTELGKLASGYIDRGDYVPDEVTDSMVEDQIKRTDGGILLDGYPRTIKQALTLTKILERTQRELDIALNLTVDRDLIVGRMLHRAEVEHRPDDTEEVIRHRIEVYHQQTEPVISHYANSGVLRTVDGSGSIDEVWQNICNELGV